MPVRVGFRPVAGGVEATHLLGRQVPADRAEVVGELFRVARSDDDGADGGSLQQPVEGDLGNALADLSGDLLQSIDHLVDVGVLERRPLVRCGVQPAGLRQRLAPPDLPGQPAPAERAPYDRTHALVYGEGHQLLLVVPSHQRVIGLVRDIAGVAVAFGDGLGLHQVPA